jgi:hypothetical protein
MTNMDKKIITEIYRQQKIMGVHKPLLKENTYVNLGTDLIKSFINLSKKTIPNVVDDVLVGSVRVSKKLLNDISNVLDDPSLFGALSRTEQELFGQIVSQSDDIVYDIYEKLMNDVMTTTGKSEKDLISMLSRRMDEGKTLSEVLTELNGQEDVFLNAVLTRKLNTKIRQIKTNSFVIEIKRGNKKFLDPTTGLEWSSPEVLQIQTQLNKFEKLLKKVGVTDATKWLKDSLKIYEPFWAQFIRNWYSNLIFNWRKVQQTNINKAKKFIQNSYKLEEEGKSSEAVRELQKALSQIIIFKKDPGTDVSEIISAFITENPNLTPAVKEMFLKSNVAGNKTIKDFIEAIADDVYNQVTKPLKNEAKSFYQLIPGLGRKTTNLSDSATEALSPSTLERWFNLISWKDPRGAYEVILGMSKRGVKKEVSSKILSYLMLHTLFIPGLISLVKTWRDNAEANLEAQKLRVLKSLCEAKYLTEGCDDVNNRLNSIKFMSSEDYFKNYLASLPIDMGRLFGGKDWNEGKNLMWESPFFFTYWDDITNSIWNFIQGTLIPFVGASKSEKILNILENSQKKITKELETMGIDPNSENLEQEVKNYYKKSGLTPESESTVSPTTTDIEGFKTFLKSDWGGAYDETNYEITSDNKYYIVKNKQTNESYYYEKKDNTFQYVKNPTNN